MPKYRRARVPGGSYFFTVVTHARRRFLTDVPACRLLGSIIRRCQLKWPFAIDAIVLLPDHLHAIWTLPPGDDEYSKRWGWIKKEFTSWYLPRRLQSREDERSVSRPVGRRSGVAAFGSRVFGSIIFVMKKTLPAIMIMCILIP